MSKISLAPNAAGTAIFTIESPGTSTNRTLTLPDDTGTIVTNSGNQAGSFTTLNTSGAVVFNDAGADVDFRVEGDTDANLLFVDASADKVGVGTNSPGAKLHVKTSAGYNLWFQTNGTTIRQLYLDDAASTNVSATYRATDFAWQKGDGVETARIDSSGNLLVGKTSSDSTTVGFEARSDGRIGATYNGGNPVYFNRLTSDGEIVRLQKDGTTVGSIGSSNGAYIYIGSSSVQQTYIGFNNNYVYPSNADGSFKDNAIDLGNASARYDDVFATNGTIQTSDRNEKQDIEELSEAETRVAVAAKGLLRKYRWKSAVAEKGDDARIHFGIIAQDLQAAFEAEGLDAGRYAMFIHSVWWEKERIIPAVEGKEAVLDDEGNVVEEAVEAQPERTVTDTFETEEEAGEGAVKKERMGIRYNELLAFIIAAI